MAPALGFGLQCLTDHLLRNQWTVGRAGRAMRRPRVAGGRRCLERFRTASKRTAKAGTWPGRRPGGPEDVVDLRCKGRRMALVPSPPRSDWPAEPCSWRVEVAQQTSNVCARSYESTARSDVVVCTRGQRSRGYLSSKFFGVLSQLIISWIKSTQVK